MAQRHPMIPVAPPTVLRDIFSADENARLFAVLRNKGPWRTILGRYFSSVEELLAVSGGNSAEGGQPGLADFLTPAFRGFFGKEGIAFEDELHEIFHSRKLLGLVKGMHGAKYAAPYLFQFNIQGPSHGLDHGHFDGRSWRGMNTNNTPTWLMSVMAKSGLFDAWEVKAGQVIAYYYPSDIDGGFTCWPQGPDRPPQRFAPPFWNSGLLTDNQHMYHRGEACGPRDRRDPPPGLQLHSLLEAEGEDGWKLSTDGATIARYEASEVRILFHYDAHVFTDMDELTRYLDHVDELNIEKALSMLIDDMSTRKIPFGMPSDPLHDREFIATLMQAYPMAPSSYPPEAPLDRQPRGEIQ